MRRVRKLSPVRDNNFGIGRSDDLINRISEITGVLSASAWIIGIITIFGSSIALMNIMLVSVTERTREIGVRKALGAKRSTIAFQFFIETLIIGQLGGIVGIIFGILIGYGISTAIDAPVRQAFTTEVVGQSDLPNAVSLNSANFNAGRLIGPAISGGLIAAFGTGPSFIINGLSYLFVIVALLNLNEKGFFHQDRPKSDGSIREGIAYAKARPDIYVVMLMVFFLATFGLNFQIFNALMATQEFSLGPASFGLMGTFIAIGSLTGAIGSARLERFRNTKFVIRGGIAFSISIMMLSILPNYISYVIWLPICGVTALTTLVSANSIVQTSTDPAIRGRVMGLYLLIFMGGTPFGSPLIGATTDIIGIRPTIALCGGIALLASLFIWFKYKNRVELPADTSVAAVLKDR